MVLGNKNLITVIDINSAPKQMKRDKTLAQFFFKPDPIDGVEFKPIKIDIHLGVIKIADEEIYYDFQPNNTESVIVGTDRKEGASKNPKRFRVSV